MAGACLVKVGFISCTQALPGHVGTPEDLIVYTARVSNPSSQQAGENNERLIRYLVEHKHWSPFEMVDMTVEIETSRAIAAQILRHRSFSFQEFSQRYATADMGFERCEARMQAVKNRQSSTEALDEATREGFRHLQELNEAMTLERYEYALRIGVAREQARMLLPLSTRTKLYMKGSVRSWIHYLQLRLAPDTQKEHRDVAAQIAVIFSDAFPNIARATGIAPDPATP